MSSDDHSTANPVDRVPTWLAGVCGYDPRRAAVNYPFLCLAAFQL